MNLIVISSNVEIVLYFPTFIGYFKLQVRIDPQIRKRKKRNQRLERKRFQINEGLQNNVNSYSKSLVVPFYEKCSTSNASNSKLDYEIIILCIVLETLSNQKLAVPSEFQIDEDFHQELHEMYQKLVELSGKK